jgi:hypothetical protein
LLPTERTAPISSNRWVYRIEVHASVGMMDQVLADLDPAGEDRHF